jgi:hypothetical protein
MVRKLLGSVLALAAFAFCSPFAAADSLPEEVGNVTGPVVETVTGATGAAVATPEEAPAPPAIPPPAPAPPVQVDVPVDPPPLPAGVTTAAPPAASALPDAVTDGSSHVLSPAVDKAAGGEATRAVTPHPSEPSQQLPETAATSAGDASNNAPPEAGETSNPEARPVAFAPAAWFVAHIWPAIALKGGDDFGVLAAVETAVFGDSVTTSPGPPASAPEPPAQPDAQPPALTPGTMTTHPGSTPVAAALSIGVKLALLSGIAALLAFLALTLRREFSSAPGTPGHRRWRAPRA